MAAARLLASAALLGVAAGSPAVVLRDSSEVLLSGSKALRGSEGPPQAAAAAVLVLGQADDRHSGIEAASVEEELVLVPVVPPHTGPTPSETAKLAFIALCASLVALLFSVLAIGLLCRMLGAAKQLEQQEMTRARSIPAPVQQRIEVQPPPVRQPGARRSSLGGAGYSDEASGAAAAPNNASRRLSRHFEDFHGVPLGDGAGAGPEDRTSSQAPDFNGSWECVETWGLDEFLQAMKVGRMRRLAASKAPWPAWEFTQSGDDFTYTNKSKFGTMNEKFKVNGPEYPNKDLEGNTSTCKATLNKEGTTLTIERVGTGKLKSQAKEIRTLDGDAMNFVLEMEGIDVKWGRRFARKR